MSKTTKTTTSATVNKADKKKTTKKVTNFNAMRPAIIAAHNDGNKKAINRDMVLGCGIDTNFFVMWQADVKKLQKTCYEYVTLKKNARFDADITEGEIYAARERIFPKWKELLSVGEAGVDTKELHVQGSDVEDLIGFSWDFFATSRGTVEAGVGETIFRKKVESLLGCAIARNMVLTDEDRDLLDKYYSAQRRIVTAQDQLAELDTQLKTFNEIISKTPESEATKSILGYLHTQVAQIKDAQKTATESKTNAQADVRKYADDAKKIEARIARAI